MDHPMERNTMGSGGDNLMNLGPFLQSYVFNIQPDKPRIPFMPRLESIENDNNVPSSGLPMRATRSRAMMPVAIQQPTVVLKRIDQDLQDVSSSPVKSNNLPLKKRHWEARKSLDKLPWISKKPKLLNEKQARIKKWLLANYVYCPRHRNAKVSSRLVLNRGIKNFGPMTQKALGYIMYHAFPGVERVKDTRRGHIFKGILDKKDLSMRYRALELEEREDTMEDLEKLSLEGGPPSCEKSDDSEDPPYYPPIPCTQNGEFKRETRGACRKDSDMHESLSASEQESVHNHDFINTRNENGLIQVNENGGIQVNENGCNEQSVASCSGTQQNYRPNKVKMETSDQGYDSNNSENENNKRAQKVEAGLRGQFSYSIDNDNCPSDDSFKIKMERMDPEYEALSSTDENDDFGSPGSPYIDTNAFLLHNPLTFPLLRRTLNASPPDSAVAPNAISTSQRRVPSPGFLPMSVTKLNDIRHVPSPLVQGMSPQQLHTPQIQYHVVEPMPCPSVLQQPPSSIHSARFDEQNPGQVQKSPQTLHEAQVQISCLMAYIQEREKKFSDLEKHFSDVSNEFRKLSHSFKQFQTEKAAFPDFINSSPNGI